MDSKKGIAHIFIILIAFVVISAIGYFWLNNWINGEPNNVFDSVEDRMPTGLSLPFNVSDIGLEEGGVNPFGLIRFDEDKGYGHGGIDFPLIKDSLIYAVADGEIVSVIDSNDGFGGKGIYQILESKNEAGEAWGFIYEHIDPQVEAGDFVKRGEVVGTKIAGNAFTAHFQLAYLFNNYEYIKNSSCWPEYLKEEDKVMLDEFWQGYRKSKNMLGAWRNVVKNGAVDFCYPMGTDARGERGEK